MSKKSKIITASLLDATAIFIGVYGIIFSIVTAYDINLNANIVLWALALSSLCFSSIFHLEKFKKTAYISVSAICAVAFLFYIGDITDGFLKFIHLITSKLNLFSQSIPVTKDVTLTYFGVIRANTAFFAFLAVVLVLLLTLSIIKARSVWLASIISICSFAISLIFIKNVPDDLPVWAFLVFLLSTILTCFIRKSSSRRASYMLSLFLPITLVLVITVNAIFPASTYDRTEIADLMYSFFSQKLPLTVKHGSNNSAISYTYSEGASGVASSISGANSGNTSSQEPGDQTALSKIDLNNASPSRTGNTILKINSSKNGNLLLRGFSLGKYTGSSWEQFDASEQNSLYMLCETRPSAVSNDANMYVTPLSLATYYAMYANGSEQYFVHISDTEQGGKLVFSPYYPVLTDFREMEMGNDSYLLYKNNSMFQKNEKAEYLIYAYSTDDITNVLDRIGATTRNSVEYREISVAEENYRNSVYAHYLQIDNDTLSFLKEYTKDQNFRQITDRKELVDAVSQFVKNSAKYNENTPQTPQGKDYLEYFLTESKQGYCMHFATEATLIFRMLGVPARYVTGYSINIVYESVGKWINATDKNAHAWTEVYFDGIGWVPVDVTPSVYQNPQTATSGDTSSENTNVPSASPHTSSEPSASTSSESTSSTEDSSATPPETVEPTPTGISIPVWIYPIALIIAAVLFIYFRRKRLLEKRKEFFGQKDTNKAVIVAWNYIEKLKAYGVNPDKSIYSTAQKAVFSKHTLSEEERQKVVGFAEEKAKELDNSLSFFKRIIFKFIKGLY